MSAGTFAMIIGMREKTRRAEVRVLGDARARRHTDRDGVHGLRREKEGGGPVIVPVGFSLTRVGAHRAIRSTNQTGEPS
jgi:hypothetical protein